MIQIVDFITDKIIDTIESSNANKDIREALQSCEAKTGHMCVALREDGSLRGRLDIYGALKTW